MGRRTTSTPEKEKSFRVLNQTVELVPVASLQPHPRNVNQGDLGAIHESIRHHGFWGTIVAQRSTGYVLAGNHRLLAAAEMGATEVPVAWVDVDDEQALKILLADNRTTRLGHDDPDALAKLLQELAEGPGLDGTGFDGDDLDELLRDLGIEQQSEAGEDPGAQIDRAAELREKWGTERGQIWAIPSKTVPGKSHRLMCGDSTSAEDVGRLLAGAEPRLMVTDPPYGVEYDANWRNEVDRANGKPYGASAIGRVTHDDESDWSEAWRLFAGAVAYVWYSDRHASTVLRSLESAGFEMRSQIIWAKTRPIISRGHYHWQHEPCWYAVRTGQNAEWKGDRSQTTLWTIEHAKSDTGHSTQKPVECMARPIRNHKGDVYDPFLGSGTTMVAAEQLARVCYGMEIDPGYVAVILERLAGMGLSPHRVTRDEE